LLRRLLYVYATPHAPVKKQLCQRKQLRIRRETMERLREPPPPPPPDPAEELLREWPELSAFSVEWVRKLAI
jgi:hypothetical protein